MRCLSFFSFHKWGKWKIIAQDQVISHYIQNQVISHYIQNQGHWTPRINGPQVVGTSIVQERTCEKCGATQQHRSNTFYNK